MYHSLNIRNNWCIFSNDCLHLNMLELWRNSWCWDYKNFFFINNSNKLFFFFTFSIVFILFFISLKRSRVRVICDLRTNKKKSNQEIFLLNLVCKKIRKWKENCMLYLSSMKMYVV
jgi:hypothetical protein